MLMEELQSHYLIFLWAGTAIRIDKAALKPAKFQEKIVLDFLHMCFKPY